jgi:hypothetical protein
MQRLRLLATSLFASACVLSAAAQTPATSLAPGTLPPALKPQPLSMPQAFTAKSLPSITTDSSLLGARPGSFHFDTSRDSSALTLDSNTLTSLSNPQALIVQPQDQKLLAQLKTQEPLLAQTITPCYTLRVYGFTPQDLKSAHPHSSRETDCTPASTAHLKAIQLPAKVNAK